MYARVMRQLLFSPSWKITSLTVEDAVDRLLSKAKLLLPRLSTIFIPRISCNIKRKCWQNISSKLIGPDNIACEELLGTRAFGAKSCERAQHACHRIIVSSSRLPVPLRRLFTILQRGVDLLVSSISPGWFRNNMSSAPISFLDACSSHKPHHKCLRCSCVLTHRSLLCADVVNMFESVPSAAAQAAVETLVQAGIRSGFKVAAIPVCKRRNDGTRVKAFLSPNPHITPAHCKVVPLDDLVSYCKLYLSNKFSNVGDVVFEQLGVPIGGISSSGIASAALSLKEWSWMTDHHRRRDAGYTDLPWTSLVSCSRYVDDLNLSSTAFCSDCLQDAFPCIYNNIVPWEFTVATPMQWVKWLDVELRVSKFTLSMRPCCPAPFEVGLPDQKVALAPFIDELSTDFASLKSNVRGRLFRLYQLKISPSMMSTCLFAEIAVMLSRGYPLHVIKKIWRLPSFFASETRFVRLLLDALSSTLPADDTQHP